MQALKHAANQTDLRADTLTSVRFDVVEVGCEQELTLQFR
jgi:hypothetical protein